MNRIAATAAAMVLLLSASGGAAQTEPPGPPGPPPDATPSPLPPSLVALDARLAPILADVDEAVIAVDAAISAMNIAGGRAQAPAAMLDQLVDAIADVAVAAGKGVAIIDATLVPECARDWALTLRTGLFLLDRSREDWEDPVAFSNSGPGGFRAMTYARTYLAQERDCALPGGVV